jgi:hypothetical protein
MSATSLDVFDKTLQTTNIWLNEICDMLGPDRRVAWKVLSVVLHKCSTTCRCRPRHISAPNGSKVSAPRRNRRQ